jgi:type III secretory pathway lipoprotein EscJ
VGSRVGLVVVLAIGACAPSVDGPLERQRITDREDADRLAGQLATLPGAVSASVTLHRPTRDPLAVTPPSPASAAALVVVDDRTDRAAITQSATALLHAAAPEITAPVVLVEVGAIRPVLAKVGPFTVEAASRGPLRAALAIALALVAALAGWIAVRERRRAS